MAQANPTYDLTLLLDLAATDEVRAKIVADARSAIESGGELIGHHDWGQRSLAYPIDKREQAEYHLLQFHAPAQLLESLDHRLRIADGVVRHRIIKLAPGTPAPAGTPAAGDTPAAADTSPAGAPAAADAAAPAAPSEPDEAPATAAAAPAEA